MASEQVKEVRSNTRNFHQYASTLFSDLASTSSNERLILLLNYLSKHEQCLADTIERTESDISEHQLNTWLQSSELSAALSSCQQIDPRQTDNASFEELVECALEIDEKVVGVYGDLAQRGEPIWISELFQNLMEMEQAEEKLLAKQTLRGMDL